MKKTNVIIIYVISSVIWIFGTNFLLDQFPTTPLTILIERAKEFFYVVLTGWFIYYSLKKNEELDASKIEEQRLSTLINSMVDFVNFKDGEGRWIQANESGLKMFQLENVDYRGKTDAELAQYTEFYADALRYCETSDEVAWNNRGITRVEEYMPSPDGTLKTFDTIKVPLFHPDGSRKGIVIIGRDITERITVERLLEESQQQYKSLFEYTPDIVYMLDLDGNITNLNPQFEKLTGYHAETYIGTNVRDFLPDPYKEEFLESIQTILESKSPQLFELEMKHLSGKQIMIQTTSLPIVVNGVVTGIIGYGKDLTLLRETEEKLRRTEKLSVVGALSASVAHEIRNPLTSLKGFVQILSVEDERHQFYYKIMLDELDRINHIVSELLLLAKPQELKYTQTDIQNLLYNVISLLNSEAALHNIQIEFLFSDKPLWIECEPNQLKQLFINIIKNAIEASPTGSTVSIFLKQVDKKQISIIVKDKGTGISEEFLKRLGEPFYSSKEKGTGLGLTVSYKIVEAHHGTMNFTSKPDQGTEVFITLPTHSSATSI